jgi:hypothetical protein
LLGVRSGPVGIGGIGGGEFEGDSPAEDVAAQIHQCRADPVQRRAWEIDKAAKMLIAVVCW